MVYYYFYFWHWTNSNNCLGLLDSRLKEVQIHWLYLLFTSVQVYFVVYRALALRVFLRCAVTRLASLRLLRLHDHFTVNPKWTVWFFTLTFEINWFIVSMTFVVHKEQAAETSWLFCLTMQLKKHTTDSFGRTT